MCKSQAEGGQRCSGHAKARMDASEAKMEAVLDELVRVDSNVTQADYDAAVASYHEDAKKYASTLEGAADLRAQLANAQAIDPNLNAEVVAAAAAMIDEGARLARVNREVENAYRATQGKPPLSTPLPQTFAEEQAAADKAAAEAEAKAAWAADPLGLRAADSLPSLALDGWTFHPDAMNSPEVLGRYAAPVIPAPATMQSVIASHARVADSIAAQTGGGDLPPNSDSPEQVRYRELFDRRNNLKDTIYAKEQTAEDAADAHEIGELDAELAAVEAEMESLETWRRPRPLATPETGHGLVNAADQQRRMQRDTISGTPTIQPGDQATTRAVAAMGLPEPAPSGFRGRREHRHRMQGFREHGANNYGAEYLEAVHEHAGRFDEKQIARVATALARHYTDNNPEPVPTGNGGTYTADKMGQLFASANLHAALNAAAQASTQRP